MVRARVPQFHHRSKGSGDSSSEGSSSPGSSPGECTPSTRAGTSCPASPADVGKQSHSHQDPLLRKYLNAWYADGEVPGVDNDRCAAVSLRVCKAIKLDEDWRACQVILTCTRMLAESSYELTDIEVCYAMAVAKLRSKRLTAFVEQMGTQERVLVAVLHTYSAHALVFDEFVPFQIWHEWLLAPFCSEKNAAGALRKVCALCGWRFSVPRDILLPVLAELRQDTPCTYCRDWPAGVEGDSCCYWPSCTEGVTPAELPAAVTGLADAAEA